MRLSKAPTSDKNHKVFYGLITNLTGLHNRIYTFRWHNDYWLDHKNDWVLDPDTKHPTGYCLYLLFTTKAEARMVLDCLKAYRNEVRERM